MVVDLPAAAATDEEEDAAAVRAGSPCQGCRFFRGVAVAVRVIGISIVAIVVVGGGADVVVW